MYKACGDGQPREGSNVFRLAGPKFFIAFTASDLGSFDFRIMLQNPLYLNLIRKGGYLHPYAEQIDHLNSVGTNESKILAKQLKRKMEYLAGSILIKMSMAHVYFREYGVEKYTTDEFSSYTDLIGKCDLSALLALRPSYKCLVKID